MNVSRIDVPERDIYSYVLNDIGVFMLSYLIYNSTGLVQEQLQFYHHFQGLLVRYGSQEREREKKEGIKMRSWPPLITAVFPGMQGSNGVAGSRRRSYR